MSDSITRGVDRVAFITGVNLRWSGIKSSFV